MSWIIFVVIGPEEKKMIINPNYIRPGDAVFAEAA